MEPKVDIDQICIHSPARSVTLDSPPLWDESLSLNARGLYATLYLRNSTQLGVTYAILAESSGSTEHMIRKAASELKGEGYLVIERERAESGVLTGRSIWHLYPYAKGVQGELANMTPEESRRRWLERVMRKSKQNPRSIPNVEIQHNGGAKTVDFDKTPGHQPNVEIQHNGGANQQNPRSIPNVEIQHNGAFSAPYITQPNVPCKSSTSSCSPKDSFPVVVPDNNPSKPLEDMDKSKGEVRLGSDRRPEKLRQALEASRGYRTSNCTMEAAVEVYEEIRKGCLELLHYDDQLQMCLPKIDAMLESDDKRWFGQILQSIRFVAGSYQPKKYPSYWLEDYGPTVLRHAELNIEFYRPPFDPVENARKLEEVKANVKSRCI